MLEFCLVGGGFIGPLHAANIAAHPAARLAWVVDLDVAAAQDARDASTARAPRRTSTTRWPTPPSAR